MENTNRVCLQPGDTIQLSWNPDCSGTADWTIKNVVGEGGSSVCYSAVCKGRKGRLKEFYPVDVTFGAMDDFIFLNRTSEHQLVPVGDGMAERFADMCHDFVGAYETLEKARSDNADSDVLNNYIPTYQVLYGCPGNESKKASVYVWTPDDRHGQGFDAYLSEVREHPDIMPVHKMFNIISTTITLTDCIKALHMAGLLHLDIKPSNFLVSFDTEFNINTANISLFDINTIYPVDSRFPRVSGTDGYRAPEVNRGRAENRSDIYSIGAMLFYAIIRSKGISDGLYREEYYDHLPQLIASSELLNASDINANIFLQSTLVRILRKCLAYNVRNRYDNCEELIADLRQARIMLLPGVASKSLADIHMQLVMVDMEKPGISSPTAILQNMLFKNPLLDWVPKNTKHINVLVLGAGTYGQKFIDLCLEVGQLPGYDITITAVSNNPEYDKDVYLQFRPALDQFVNVNGSLDNTDAESYGTLNFVSVPQSAQETSCSRGFSVNDMESNRSIVDDIMAEDAKIQYVLIALGDDELNQQMADIFTDAADALDMRCSVNFVIQDLDCEIHAAGNPVYVAERVTAQTIHPELERMALNTHLSWNSTLNVDMESVQKEFRERYYYESSLAFALSIRYKLSCLGIQGTDYKEMAKMYAAKLEAEKNGDQNALRDFRDMIAFEHRRWTVEKLVNGWQAPLDAEGNIDFERCVMMGRMLNKTHDADKKLHPCIVRSTSAMPLPQWKRSQWDATGDIAELDELDAMSVGLHRCFRKHADKFKRQHTLYSGDMELIQHHIADAGSAVSTAYKRFEMCLKRILEGNEKYSRQYKHYAETFLASIGNIPDDIQQDIRMRMNALRREFYPVIESNLYRDYKDNDTILVKKIPFILTHSTQPYVAMAFDDGRMHGGRNDEIFRNVASAMVLNPAQITYLYCFDENSRIPFLAQKIKSVLNYMRGRGMTTKIRFLLAFVKVANEEKTAQFAARLEKRLYDAGLSDFDLLPCASEEDAIGVLMQALSNESVNLYDGATSLFSTHMSNASFLGQIREKYPYFEFNPKRKRFHVCLGCEYLNYINDGSFIRVGDMFALKQASENKFQLPEFATDYETLWSIYARPDRQRTDANHYGHGVANWTRLCNLLKAYENSDGLGMSKLLVLDEADRTAAARHLEYTLPGFGYKAAGYLVDRLKENNVVASHSMVSDYSSDICKIDIYTYYPIEQALNDVFSNPQRFTDMRCWSVSKNLKDDAEYLQIAFDDMDVEHLVIPRDKYSFFTFELLEKLRDTNFLRNCTIDRMQYTASFSYPSPRIKSVLTKAGEILEIYVYYEALKTGYFDDVASGYEFQWEYGNVENELDCVLTKGFRSLMVECKAKSKLDQESYHKFNNLAEQFGIACTKVFIANTADMASNEVHSIRGEQMNIITISSSKDIMNIGNVLVRIMEGTFQKSKK